MIIICLLLFLYPCYIGVSEFLTNYLKDNLIKSMLQIFVTFA